MSLTKGLFNREILTPSALAAKVQESFDRDFGHIWVEGEITELSLPQSGHAYFVIKDKEARLKAVMWKGRRPYAGSALTEGMSVLAKGRLVVYAPRGDFQLVADYLEPKGEGALRLAFEKLKASLSAEGLFNEERKRPLPFWPAKVALISSPSGAAARDFIQTALRLRPGAAISLYPVRVQGEGAAREIAAAVADLNTWGGFDLIVLSRGGGSLSDLWAFNEEIVVRAVAASRTVTLAAIGHSTDLSLAELAADQRAITPTAAAEAAYRDAGALLEHLGGMERRLLGGVKAICSRHGEISLELEGRLKRGILNLLERDQRDFKTLRFRLGRFEDRLGLTGQRLDDLNRRLAASVSTMIYQKARGLGSAEKTLRLVKPSSRLIELTRRLDNLDRQSLKNIENRLENEQRRLASLAARLEALSPESILKRGYALVSRANGLSVQRAGDLSIGEDLSIRLAEGRFTSTVKDIEA